MRRSRTSASRGRRITAPVRVDRRRSAEARRSILWLWKRQLPFRRMAPACGLDAMRIQNRGDQSREAPLDLLAAAHVAHFHAVPFAPDQPCFPERSEVL